MRQVIIVISGLLVASITLGLFGPLVVLRSLPQLSLLLVLALAAERPKGTEAVICAISAGIILDTYLSLPIGTWTIGLVLSALLMQFLFRVFLSSSVIYIQLLWLSPLFVVGIFIWIWLFTTILHGFSSNFLFVGFYQTLRLAVGSAMYSLVLFFPIYWLSETIISFLNRLDARKGRTV